MARLRTHKAQIVLGLCVVALAALLLRRGASFYGLSLDARVDHPDFRVLSPGSPVGHGYGVVGTALIFTNLLYLARRRFAAARLGSMRNWLDLHVFTGLFGSVLVVFHSAFQARSQVAILTSVSLGFVVVSGIIGRYFYGLTPTADLSELRRVLDALERFLPGVSAPIMQSIRALPAPTSRERASLAMSLAAIPAWRREQELRRQAVHDVCAGFLQQHSLDPAARKETKRLINEAGKLARQPVRAAAGASLLRSWRSLHRFTALLMILSVTVHIVVAWVFGFRWIFSS